jgi:uncharacterized membrane protein YeaQ/YmgE (transglycosylase-associated protein family)
VTSCPWLVPVRNLTVADHRSEQIGLGILGGVLGGWIFGLLGIWPGGGVLGAIIVPFVGAVILVGITRVLKRA